MPSSSSGAPPPPRPVLVLVGAFNTAQIGSSTYKRAPGVCAAGVSLAGPVDSVESCGNLCELDAACSGFTILTTPTGSLGCFLALNGDCCERDPAANSESYRLVGPLCPTTTSPTTSPTSGWFRDPSLARPKLLTPDP